MANKDNQSKQYRIYIKEAKNWVDVNKELLWSSIFVTLMAKKISFYV